MSLHRSRGKTGWQQADPWHEKRGGWHPSLQALRGDGWMLVADGRAGHRQGKGRPFRGAPPGQDAHAAGLGGDGR